MGEDGVVVERGSVFFYADGAVDPADVPEGMVGVPVHGDPHQMVSAFPEPRALGRLVRRIVDDCFATKRMPGAAPSYGEAVLYALADSLDPEHGVVGRQFSTLVEHRAS